MFIALLLAILIPILARETVALVVDCKLALAGVQRPCKPTPRGRLVLLQAGSLVLKVEVQVV